MLTAPTWTYSAAGGPNPFIVPARGGFIATAVNTESGATIVGLGRNATRFARPLKLEPRGVAIFAQPAPGTLPDHVWVVGYSTTPGVAPRLISVSIDGQVVVDVARPELGWREGRTASVTETPHGVIVHADDRHLILAPDGALRMELPRQGSDAPFVVEAGRLYAYEPGSIHVVSLADATPVGRVPLDGRPAAIRVDPWNRRLVVRVERVLLSLDLEPLDEPARVRAMVGGLFVSPSVMDSNLRAVMGPPAGVECLDDDGAPRWSVIVKGTTSMYGAGFLVGGEALLTATQPGGDRVLLVRDGAVLFERPRAGAAVAAGTLARVGDRVAVRIAPGAAPSELVEFGTTIDVASLRGGGAIAFERSTSAGIGGRMVIVDPAGAHMVDVTEGGGGARWAASSDGLIAVPRTNAARIDLFDGGAPT